MFTSELTFPNQLQARKLTTAVISIYHVEAKSQQPATSRATKLYKYDLKMLLSTAEHQPAAAAASAAAGDGGDVVRALSIVADEIIYAFRIGCFLHVLPLHLLQLLEAEPLSNMHPRLVLLLSLKLSPNTITID